MKIFAFILICLGLVLLYLALTKRYLSPYKLYILFGKKGVGKSTLLQKLAVYYSKKGYHVYCNKGDSNLPCAVPIDIQSLSKLSLNYKSLKGNKISFSTYNKYLGRDGQNIEGNKISPAPAAAGATPLNENLEQTLLVEGIDFIYPKSVILCDEINLFYDNRDFKSFPKEMQTYFRLQRHYQHIFIGFSQTYDCDKKIRDLADELVIVNRFARIFITSKSYVKKPVIISPEKNASTDTAKMTDDFVSIGLIGNLFSPFHAFLPKWVKMHDSFKS